jgi:hypothetical protein
MLVVVTDIAGEHLGAKQSKKNASHLLPALFFDCLTLEDDIDRLYRNVVETANIRRVTSQKNEDHNSWTCFLANSIEQNLHRNQQFLS